MLTTVVVVTSFIQVTVVFATTTSDCPVTFVVELFMSMIYYDIKDKESWLDAGQSSQHQEY